MRKSRLRNAVHKYLAERGSPASIHAICDTFARRKGCMSTTGMGRMLQSDHRFQKIGDSWYLTQPQAIIGMNIKPIWVVSILINLFGVIHNIQFNISSKSVLLLSIALIVLCLYMLLRKNRYGKEKKTEPEPGEEEEEEEEEGEEVEEGEETQPDLGPPDV